MPAKVSEPIPSPNHVCKWVWDGIDWQGSMTGCAPEETCVKPPPGFFIGQTAETECGTND